MQHHRRAPVIASIAAMADDSDKNLAHNDEAQLQRLLDSMGQESAAAPRPPKKKSSKGSAGQESAAPRPQMHGLGIFWSGIHVSARHCL